MTSHSLRVLREATLASDYVSMGTRRLESVHEYYRYPGRFTPSFARAAIRAFSRPGEVVLDPFLGGGTTLVEARLSGRIGIGADISHLATFVSEAKTATPTQDDARLLRNWAHEIEHNVRLTGPTNRPARWDAEGYFNGLDSAETWRIRDFLIRAISVLPRDHGAAHLLARCALLRTAQWALDIRRTIPSLIEFRAALVQDIVRIATVSEQYAYSVRAADARYRSLLPRTTIIQSPASELSEHPNVADLPGCSLVLTSPPYPGVYVLYHRWKLRGRREISTPFWLAGSADGNGLSHYTMGARARVSLDHYFARVRAAYEQIISLVRPGGLVVQLIGFSDVDAQLPSYLEIMESIGLDEVRFPALATDKDGRLWRTVPSRRWWVTAKSKRNAKHTTHEVVLIHRVR